MENNVLNDNMNKSYSKNSWLSQFFKIKSTQIYYGKNVRKNFKNTIFIILFLLISFVISFGIAAISGSYDMGFLFSSLFGFGDFVKEWLVFACILGVSGLSFLFAHKSGLFNIGISGQMLAAGLAVVGLSKGLTDSAIIQSKAAVLISIIVAMLTGAFVASISGILKNFFNINEVVSAIMLNWIIFYLAKFLIIGSTSAGGGLLKGNDNGDSIKVAENLSLYDSSLKSGVVGAIIIFVVLIALIWVIFKFTSYGKKIISIGKAQQAGVYSGFYTKSLQLSSFVISGAIAGLLGLIVYTGNTYEPQIQSDLILSNALPVEGFNGIAIALVSFSNPIVVVPISLLFAMVQFANGYPTGLSDLTLSLAMYSVAIFVIIYRVQPILWFKKKIKHKYKENHFINAYDEERKEYINFVRKKIADRNIQIFLAKQKYKNKEINSIKDEILRINQEFINDINYKKQNLVPWYKSLSLKINSNKEGGI